MKVNDIIRFMNLGSSNPRVSQVVEKIHSEFAAQVGSEQIAQKAGLQFLGELIYAREFKNFLEIGSGIGTIAKFISELLADDSINLNCFEVNSWCENKLRENMGEVRYALITSVSQLLTIQEKMDLVIIDDLIDYVTTTQMLENTRPEIVFIEGHRRMQRLFVLRAMRSLGMNPKFKNYSKTKDSYKLGCTISASSGKGNYKRALCFIVFSLMYSKVIEIRSRVSLRSLFRASRLN